MTPDFLILKRNNKAIIYKNGSILFNKSFTSMKKACAWLLENDPDYVSFVASRSK